MKESKVVLIIIFIVTFLSVITIEYLSNKIVQKIELEKALASHNRSRYAHYFERINELQNGDEIIYKTKLGTKKYAVYENKVIESTDWSVIENTKENIITLITCVKNNQAKRLCVRAKEI